MADLFAVVIAAAIMLGAWACMAAPIGYLTHWRMRRVESELGSQALPRNEVPLLLMAVASIAWPVSVVVALVGCINRKWARLGRNATFLFLAQITATVLSAIALAIRSTFVPPRSPAAELVSIVIVACGTLAFGLLVGSWFLWLWAGRRADRLRAEPPRGAPPGPWRFAIYAASFLFWPVGVALVALFSAPENAHVGANAFRCSLVNMAIVGLAVCVALPVVVGLLA